MIWLNIPSKDYNLVNVKYYDVNKKLNQRLREARKLTDDWESKLICLYANESILQKIFKYILHVLNLCLTLCSKKNFRTIP